MDGKKYQKKFNFNSFFQKRSRSHDNELTTSTGQNNNSNGNNNGNSSSSNNLNSRRQLPVVPANGIRDVREPTPGIKLKCSQLAYFDQNIIARHNDDSRSGF